jgi:hypothetical protein
MRPPRLPSLSVPNRPRTPRPTSTSLFRAVLALLTVGTSGVACAPPAPERPDEPVSEPAPAPNDLPADEGLRLMLSLGQLDAAPGASVRVRIVLTNQLPEPRILDFPSAQRFDLRLLDESGAEVFLWSAGQMFAQFLGTETLAAVDPERPAGTAPVEGASLEWETEIAAPGTPGSYRVEAWIPAIGLDLSTSIPITVRTP